MNRITDADVMQPICTHKISVKFDAVARIPDIRLPREFRRLAGQLRRFTKRRIMADSRF